jgi:hypothetical protein
MRLSIYTCVRDAIYWDLHAEAMLRHHLPLADEIIINEGFSSDDTFERVSAIDPKIRVFRQRWPEPGGLNWYSTFKDPARRECTGDWCLHLDCDEFIPEWEFATLRARLESAKEDLLSVQFLNFYGNYKVHNTNSAGTHWPNTKMVIHRNRADIEFWGDGSNVRVAGVPFAWPATGHEFTVHHFGFVRHAARLREKWRNQQGRVYGTTSFRIPGRVFDWLPHKWNDPALMPFMQPYEGPYINAVVADPDEFVRDGFATYEWLRQRQG